MRRTSSASSRTVGALAALALAVAWLAAAAPSAEAGTTFGYVNMGDSLSSGEGTFAYTSNTNGSGNMCHRSLTDSYSAQFLSITINSYSLQNVACSGAGTAEIHGKANPNTGQIPDAGENPQDAVLSSATRLVTISIGINDLNLIGDATNCYLLENVSAEDTCFLGIPNSSDYQTRLAKLPKQLDGVYSDIRSHAPNATVAVLTYPQIYPATYTGACQTFPGSGFALVTSQQMLNTAHSLLNTLNNTIAAQVATYPNFILVDESNALSGHDVCSSDPWVNQVDLTVGWPPQFVPEDESLHPNDAGYREMASILARRLDAGYFANGTTDQSIVSAFKADGGIGGFGYPTDNGGGAYVHYWSTPGANVEDFSSGSFGPAIMVDGPDGAFFINYGFRTYYISDNYAKTCLAPTDNAYAYNGGTRQDFVNCYMTWTSSGGVVVHGPNPTTCTDYGGSTMTGPNACVGFHTAPPPGKPASGNVWYSGGGVGLYGQEIWTYANGTTATSTAVYNLTGLSTTNAWQLQAYIPNNYSSASHAHYHYCSPGGGCADAYVNQNDYTNQWATFGGVCTSDGTVTITLADDGGDVYPAIVGADAIRAVRTGIAC